MPSNSSLLRLPIRDSRGERAPLEMPPPPSLAPCLVLPVAPRELHEWDPSRPPPLLGPSATGGQQQQTVL